MTPGEKKDLVSELSTVLATVIDRKLEPIVTRLGKLEAVGTQHAAGIRDARVEVTRSKHEIEAETNDKVLGAVRHLSGAVESLATELQSVKEQLQPRAVVELSDGRGGKSIRPASLVAAESSVRTENAQQGMAKVVLDAALDTTKAKDNSIAAKNRATATLIAAIVQGLIVGGYTAWQAIEHAAHGVAP